MLKIGTSYYKGVARPVCLIQGSAIRDGEHAPVQGKAHGKTVVAAAQSRDGETTFVTLNGWRDKAGAVAAVRKMDSLLTVGVLKEKSLGGVTYYDLDVDFLCVSGRAPTSPLFGQAGQTGPDGEQWEDMEHTRQLWQRLGDEEVDGL